MDAQKNRLIEMVILSTQNICFGWEIRIRIFIFIVIFEAWLYILMGHRLQFPNMYIVFLAHWIRISDILPWVRNSYLTHVILPRQSREDCSWVVLELRYMILKWRHFLVKVRSSINLWGTNPLIPGQWLTSIFIIFFLYHLISEELTLWFLAID